MSFRIESQNDEHENNQKKIIIIRYEIILCYQYNYLLLSDLRYFILLLSCFEDDKFSAKEFVDCLLGEGSTILCDDSVESFSRTDVPPFYDDELYERLV